MTRLLKRRGRGVTRCGLGGLDACRGVAIFLVRSSLVRLIVLPAPRVAALATMVLTAAKGTAQITPARVAGMRQEANPAVAAPHGAALQIGTTPQGRLEHPFILTNKRTGVVVLVPILAKRENFPDGYSKTAKFSVKMLIVICMSSSYSLDANASRGRARIFYAYSLRQALLICATNPRVIRSPTLSYCPADSASLWASRKATWKEKPNANGWIEAIPILPFQVVGQFS